MVEINVDALLSEEAEESLARIRRLIYQLDLVMDIIEDRHWARGFLDRRSIVEEMCKRIAKERDKGCLSLKKEAHEKNLDLKPSIGPGKSSPGESR